MKTGITAFIDILGFSDKVLNASSESDFNLIIEDLKKVQQEFDCQGETGLLSTDYDYYETKVLAFSDCIVVNINIESVAAQFSGEFDPIASALHSIIIAQACCVKKSIFLRGGIGKGWWFHDKDMLVSQGLVNAFRTEKTIVNPIIALDSEFTDYFTNHAGQNCYSNKINPVKNLLKTTNFNGDNKYFLDYLGVWFNELLENDSEAHALNWIQIHAENITAGWKNANCPRVQGKYEWLAQYHNDFVDSYQIDKKFKCKF
ncbi:MAG: hypothetical protein ACF8OB_18880 [Phycisphaeraceae bacterium JB051]